VHFEVTGDTVLATSVSDVSGDPSAALVPALEHGTETQAPGTGAATTKTATSAVLATSVSDVSGDARFSQREVKCTKAHNLFYPNFPEL
jgi:hypothetical protein